METDDHLGAQLRPQLDARPGDVLIHPEAFLSALDDLIRDGFTFRRFLDLCGVIEACVLNERLLMVASETQAGRMMDASPFVNDLMLESGLVVGLSVKAPMESLMRQFDRIGQRVRAATANISPWIYPNDAEDQARLAADLAIVEGVFWEETLEVPYLPTAQQSASFASTQALTSRQLLYLRYAEGRDRLLEVRRREEIESPSLPVPPIALEVLRRSADLEDISTQTLVQRDKLARLRAIRRELDELTRDRTVAPGRKRSKRQAFERHWRKEVESELGEGSGEAVIGFPATATRMDQIAEWLDASASVTQCAPVPHVQAAAFASKVLATVMRAGQQGVDWLQGAPFRVLGTHLRHALRTSPAAIDATVQRLFRYEVTEADLQLAGRLVDALPTALHAQVEAPDAEV
jgi:hypothetical protein